MDISGATNSSLQVTNAQSTNIGYYMAVAKNASGWVPSGMAWLSVVSGITGIVPFSNVTNLCSAGQARDYNDVPLGNCTAQVVAGPALDEMQPVGTSVAVVNGYYGNASLTRSVSGISAGQSVYYRVDITSTNVHAQSTVLNLVAGPPTPSITTLQFPEWWVGEGLEPLLDFSTLTNQVRVPGETFSLTNIYYCYTDFGVPTAQWRKNGNPIPGATNFPEDYPDFGGDFQAVLTITNVQAADAGIYDLVVLGNDWIIGPKTKVSVQLTNGQGMFQASRVSGAGFTADLLGVAGRNYQVQWSSNLTSWNNLQTLTNLTGTVSFTNTSAPAGTRFYRTVLLP